MQPVSEELGIIWKEVKVKLVLAQDVHIIVRCTSRISQKRHWRYNLGLSIRPAIQYSSVAVESYCVHVVTD